MADEQERSFTDIDQYNLDKEWIAQPTLFHKYAKKLADAKNDLAEAKAELDVVEAEVANALRTKPVDFGLPKVTDAIIEMAIKTQPEYQAALKEYNLQKHRVDIFQAAVTALEHKRSALEGLVKLHGQDYFSEPRVPKGSDVDLREKIGKNKRDEAFKPRKQRGDDDD